MNFSGATAGRDLRPSPRAVRRAVEVVLVLALAAQSARLLWALVTPLDPIGTPAAAPTARAFVPPPDLSVLERFAPVTPPTPLLADGAMATPAAPVAPPITGYSLHGVRSSIFGDGGSAILSGPDGKQASYRPGQTVGPGVTLAAIGRDAVTLTGAGGSVRLEVGAAPVQAAAAAAPAPPPSPGLILPQPPPTAAPPGAGDAAASPQTPPPPSPGPQGERAGGAVGAQAGPALRRAGLGRGDVSPPVNGQPAGPDRADRLAAGLVGLRQAYVQLQRNDLTMITRTRTGAR